MQAIADMLKINMSITHLDLSKDFITTNGAIYIANALEHNTTLLNLNLRHNRIGMEGTVALAKALNVNETLKVLDIDWHPRKKNGVQSGDEVATSFAKTLLVNKSLISMDLNLFYFSLAGLKAITMALQENCTIERLGLLCDKYNDDYDSEEDFEDYDNEYVDYDSDEYVDDVVSDNENIFFNDKAEEICKMLKNNNTLTTLCLYSGGLTTHGVALIVEGLQHNFVLKSLDLYFNNIGNDGAKVIANMLYTNKTISELDLSNNFITSDGLQKIALALRQNISLARLILKYNESDDRSNETMLKSLLDWNETLIFLKWPSARYKNLPMIGKIVAENNKRSRIAPKKAQHLRSHIYDWLFRKWILKKC
jgi:NLR family CARD domain-containing protein 3